MYSLTHHHSWRKGYDTVTMIEGTAIAAGGE